MTKKVLSVSTRIFPLVPLAVIFIILAFVTTAVMYPSLFPAWTGFQESTDKQSLKVTETSKEKTVLNQKEITKTTYTDKLSPAKSLWDWMSLLLAPATLAGLGFLFQASQDRVKDAKEKADKARDADQQREEALQNYLNQLSELLVDKNLKELLPEEKQEQLKSSQEVAASQEVSTGTEQSVAVTGLSIDPIAALEVVKARTLSLLRMFDKDMQRKSSVLSFLGDVNLLTELKLDLAYSHWGKANLKRANLKGCKLQGADLSGSNLMYADLSNAQLYDADLQSADLSHARLIGTNLGSANLNGVTLFRCDLTDARLNGTDLSSADLSLARLHGANLNSANLSGADLSSADFKGADIWNANLSKAILFKTDLRDTKNLTEQQLEGENPVLICFAKLPEGSPFDPDRDCDRLLQVWVEKERFKDLNEAKHFIKREREMSALHSNNSR